MIPLRYREMLPPHMYEIGMAERHFGVMELVVDDREKSIDDLGNQFVLKTATWALPIWEWIYFHQEQIGTLEQRREAIRRKRWAKRPFTLPTLRLIGGKYGNLLDVQEDFLAKQIRFVYSVNSALDVKALLADFEYIRPVHINKALPSIHVDFHHQFMINSRIRFRSRVWFFGGRPWYLDGVELLNGAAPLSGWTGERARYRNSLELKVSHPNQNRQEGTIKVRQNYWLLNGSVSLDGSRLLSSTEKIEIV
ncbi:putative phage tail protein [Paenibacillus sp. BJ-4]|uniref:putative phage tail protein n=1 Tax=Paenibacillus sp. BJ-4 TaxID=2878097 RepID=UPI001CF0B0D4|nr:putative phage tail protein [Paenibacillus sp. BJ-4]